MTLRRLLIIILGLLIVLAAVVGLTSIDHPIILKWVTGSARHHGKPIPATVYTNGEVNDNIKVFYTDVENNYLISVTEQDSSETFKLFVLNLKEKWIGQPTNATKTDYDFIAGHLFQSETGEHFLPLQDDVSGRNFDPQFSFTDRQIRFIAPRNHFWFDSIRVALH